MNSLEMFDDLIRSKSLLMHYFYQVKWNNGELTKEELQIYVKEYLPLAKAIPGVVSRVRDRAVEKRPDLLEAIDENIAEETEHIALWKKFGNSLGLTDAEMESYEATAEVKEAIADLEALAESSFEEGVSAMYAMELELPAVAKTKKEGLCKYYDLPESNTDAHIYFDEHLNEEEHFAVWRKVEIDPAVSKVAVEKSLAAQHKVLDGVCKACNIEPQPCACM